MAEYVETLSENPKTRVWQNPITIKELRSRMRGRRAYVILTINLLFLSFLVSMIYLGYLDDAIALALRLQTELIAVAPCCQAELAAQWRG